MLGTDQCCTYVPDNTRDGKDLDLILQKMQKLSNRMPDGEQGLQGHSKETLFECYLKPRRANDTHSRHPLCWPTNAKYTNV